MLVGTARTNRSCRRGAADAGTSGLAYPPGGVSGGVERVAGPRGCQGYLRDSARGDSILDEAPTTEQAHRPSPASFLEVNSPRPRLLGHWRHGACVCGRFHPLEK
jgi:hypothetical protein